MRSNMSWAARSCSRASSAGSRDAATRRTPGGRGRDGRRSGCGRAARSPRGRARRRPSPSLSERARARLDPEGPVRAAGRVRSSSRASGGGGDVGSVAAGGRLDQLDQRPADETQSSCSHAAWAAASAASYSTETVVAGRRSCTRPRSIARPSPRAARVADGRSREGRASRPPGRARRRAGPAVYMRAASPVELGDRVGLLDQRRRGGELAGVDVRTRRGRSSARGRTASAPVSRASRTWRVASSSHVSSSHSSDGDATGQPEPADVVSLLPSGTKPPGPPQRIDAGDVALGEPRRPGRPAAGRPPGAVAAAGGAARAASAISTTPRPLPRRPAKIAAPSASRYVSRASAGVERFEALRPPRAATAAHRCRAGGRTRSGRAAAPAWPAGARRAGRSPPSRAASAASSGAPASNLACAAASARVPRRAGSGVSSVARSRNAAAAATPPRACARSAERSSSAATVLVGSRRRVGTMPRPPVGIDLGIGRLGQRAMHLPAVGQRSPPGRPPSAPADDGTAPGHRARSTPPPRPARPRPARSRAARPRATARSRRPPARPPPISSSVCVCAGSDSSAPQEALLDLARQRPRVGHARTRRPARPPSTPGAAPAGRAGCRGSRRRSGPAPARRAARGRPSPAAPGHRRRSDRPTTSSGSPASSSLVARLAHREHQRDRLGQQPPRDEREHLRRGLIEPLGVVDHADERLLARPPRTAGRAPPDPRGSDRAPPRHSGRTPCRARRAAGPAGAPGGPASARTADAARRTPAPSRTRRPPPARRGSPRRCSTQIVQQRGLADPGLAAQDQHPALAGPHVGQQLIQRLALAAPPAKARPSLTMRHNHRLPGEECWGSDLARAAASRRVRLLGGA